MNSKVFNVYNQGDLLYINVPSFEKTGIVKHGFSTKLGGVSNGIFSSLNLGFNRGDDEFKVKENFRIMCDALGIDENRLVFSDQIHEDKVCIVKLEDCKGDIEKREIKKGFDGLMTNESQVPLVTFYADCVPLLFLDPVKKVVATVHAGWKGTVLKIGGKTVNKMIDTFDCNPKDILVGIMPSIGPCCFEVGDEVVDIFRQHFKGHEENIILDGKQKNKHINLWEANKLSLLETGILRENITVTDLCTKCHKDIFYSHRGHNGKRGSLAAFIQLL